MSFPRYPQYQDSGVDWLGQVPEHWECVRVKNVFTLGRGRVISLEDVKDEGSYPVFSSQTTNAGCLGYIETFDFDCNQLTWTTDGANAGTVFLRSGKHNCTNVCGTMQTRSNANFDLRFGFHLLSFATQFYKRPDTNGAKIMNGEMAEIVLTAPPLAEQTRIAEFLDRETGKIDALVAEQQRLMALLKEKRQAVISHAVTKGLNPKAPLKPSGIEWLGDVPAHWRVMTLGRITVSCCDGPFGSGLKSEHYTESGVRVVRLQNIRSYEFDDSGEAFVDADYYESELSGHDVIGGEVLIAGLGDDKNTVGRACVAPVGIEPAMVKADCFRFRIDTKQGLPKFVASALCVGSAADAGILSTGSTRSRIPLSVMATRKIPVPSIAEQSNLAEFIQKESNKFDTLTAEAQRAIDLLQERRTALISAAVTGQIDVRQT